MTHLDLHAPAAVRRVTAACADAGGRVLLVGGGVRDHLMGQPVKDWDLEVFGLPADDLERALRRVGRVDTVGRAFSVFKLTIGGEDLDVSLPRRDSKRGPGHRGILAEGDPDLSIEEASRRRDLTLNAMMVDLHTGALLDPWGGADDLAAGRLRPVDVDTFLEDPLRTLRAVQFAARFGFDATDDLEALCREASLDELPAERVLGEWVKLLIRGRHLAHGLALARRTDVLRRVLPELAAGSTPDDDARLDEAVPIRDGLEPEGRQLALMVALQLLPLPPPAREATCDRLNLHRWVGYPTRARALEAAAHADDPVATPADVRWLATRAEVRLSLALRAARGLDVAAASAHAEQEGVWVDKPPPLLHGRHLKALAVPPGPQMGQVLRHVYARQLDGQVTTREEALDAAAAWLQDAPP